MVSTFENQCEESESPYLLDPTDADDVALLAFNEEGNAMPVPNCSNWAAERVHVTIDRLKLNQHAFLTDARRKIWADMTKEINLYLYFLERSSKGTNPGAKRDAAVHAANIYKMTREDAELSSVARWCLLFKNEPHLLRLVA